MWQVRLMKTIAVFMISIGVLILILLIILQVSFYLFIYWSL